MTRLFASEDWGLVKTCLVNPCSTIKPFLITRTLSVVSEITPISCVIIITAKFLFFVSSFIRFNI